MCVFLCLLCPMFFNFFTTQKLIEKRSITNKTHKCATQPKLYSSNTAKFIIHFSQLVKEFKTNFIDPC